MAYIFHVYTDLMRTSGLQTAFHQSDIAQTLQYGVMGNSRFALVTLRENRHLHPVTRIASDITFDTPFILLHDSPNQSTILAFGRFIEKLKAQMGFRFRLFSYDQQPGSIFVDTVDQA